MAPRDQNQNIFIQLRSLATTVRRIGDGWRGDPERIALEKDLVASQLQSLARELER
ncbi:MAG: hypothetical protein AAF530_07360 [Pseudomonadota bacterium]